MPTKCMNFKRAVHEAHLDDSQGQRNKCIERYFSMAADNL